MKRIFISILSLLGIVALASAANLYEYPDLESYVGSEKNPIKPEPMQYLADNDYYLQLNSDGTKISKFETRTGKEVETIFDVSRTRENTVDAIEGFTLSADETKILVYNDSKKIYRRSFDASHYVYEIRTRLLKPVSENFARQQSVMFSPDGRMVAFVADNNIMIKKLDYGTEVNVTTDGAKNRIINGVADWTYEEEFGLTTAFTWSPDNLTLSYLKFNESEVPTYSFPLYEGACNPMKEYALYPGEFSYKYPVAGQRNSVVTLHSYDIETRKTKDIRFNDSRIEYIPRITYAYAPDRLIVTTLNRDQTRMEMYLVNPKSTVVKSLLVEESKAWLSTATYENPTFYPDFFIILSSRTGYQHIYQYSYSGALMRTVTSGDFEVDQYYGYNAVNGCHYFRSTVSGPISRVVSSIDKKDRRTDITPAEGYATATFSPAASYFMVNYSNVTTPPQYALHTATNNKVLRTLETNKSLAEKYASAPKPEFFTMNSDGYTLNGYIIKPLNFNPTHRYPVVMYQYSGPESQEVLNRWNIDWANYFAKVGYVIVCVDGRGTGGRGRAFSNVVYKNLGHYESIDQVAAARYAASLPYVDPNRIGIYGWSYGGYEAIMAASQSSAPYAAAVAVAPVTDWRYYDTVYAERYMLTPAQNAEGYEASSAMSLIQNRTCPLLIISGTADDNVHFFNSVQYIASCESKGTWCDLMLFPNMNHFINGCNSRALVYARMLDYFNRTMK